MWGDYNPRPWDRFRWRGLLDVRYLADAGGLVENLAGPRRFWPMFIWADDPAWPPGRVRALLASRGVRSWGWVFYAGSWTFRVPAQQGHWAQWVLLAAGVPVRGRLLAGPRAFPSGWAWLRCVGDPPRGLENLRQKSQTGP